MVTLYTDHIEHQAKIFIVMPPVPYLGAQKWSRNKNTPLEEYSPFDTTLITNYEYLTINIAI